MPSTIALTGTCHCGHVTYTALVDPDSVSICHCTDCQSLTGSAFRVTVSARREDVSLTGADPSVYKKRGETGAIRYQHFCSHCGSPVYVTGDTDGMVGLRWGGIDQRGQLVPTSAIWCSSAVPWLDDVTSLPGTPKD